MKYITNSFAMLSVATVLSGSISTIFAQTMSKKPAPMPHKFARKIKRKARCGMIYSAADAKKYHYICPMDHKPLVKMAGGKARKKK